MRQLERYHGAAMTPSERVEFCSLTGPYPLHPDSLAEDGADAHLMVLGATAQVNARCSLWWRSVPFHPGERLGLIGHYAAADAAAGERVLRFACRELAARRCSLALGPIDGNTWKSYRLITDRGSEPLFFLEPDNPDGWPAHFIASGLEPWARYCSSLDTRIDQAHPFLDHLARALTADGIRIRRLRRDELVGELRRIHTVVTAAFRDTPLFTPIDERDFVGLFAPLEPFLEPELVLIAQREERPIAFVFGIPDQLQAARGERIDTVVVKTLAVHPEFSARGLGIVLVGRSYEAARRLGYSRAIHALMHEGSKSHLMSSPYARVIRRYALFGMRLAAG